MYLGSDGNFHLHEHGTCQEVVIPLPLGRVLSMRCHECGDASAYQRAVEQINAAELPSSDDAKQLAHKALGLAKQLQQQISAIR